MIFGVPALLAHISSVMTLYKGDVVITGTPEGVGPVAGGDKVTAGITGVVEMEFAVKDA